MTKEYGQLCPIARTLDMIGDRWTMLILRDMFLGATKFTEFCEHSPGMPTKILSDRLKSLEHHQIIERRIYSEHPLRAEYHLTIRGRALEPLISEIYTWGMKHTFTPSERHTIRKRIATRARGTRPRVTLSR